MKIHSDILTTQDLYRELPAGCYLTLRQVGSRKRDHGFDVGMSAEHGADAHGLKRVYARNSGHHGAASDFDRAATWIEWGDWMVALFKVDPDAIIGTYDGVADFIATTTRYAPHRPERENAVKHAERWAEELEVPAGLLGRFTGQAAEKPSPVYRH